MKWERERDRASQVALMPAYKNAMARSSSAGKWWRWRLRTERCRAGGIANIMYAARRSWIRGCKAAGRRVARPGWPGAQPNDKRRRRAGQNRGQHFAGIRRRLGPREPGKPNLASFCPVSPLTCLRSLAFPGVTPASVV
jgi:hypothetical protein